MPNNIDFFIDIQQLILGPITNDDSDNSETVSNPDLIDDDFFFQIPCYHKRCNLCCIFKKRKNKNKIDRIEHQPANTDFF